MRRIVLLFLCAAAIGALNFLSGCGGGSNNTSSKVATVTISPTILSLTKGQTLQITVQTLDSNSNAVTPLNGVTFSLTPPTSTTQSPASLASISTAGLLCGGVWDSTVNPVVCQTIADNSATPTVDEGVGTMILTATADGITSSPVTVYVHEAVTGITASQVSTSTPAGPGGCVSQGTEVLFTAAATGPGGADITSTVGPINFVSTASTVAAVDTTVTPAPPPTDSYLKANVPGKTLVYASISGTNGSATALYTCAPASIVLSPSSNISIATKGTKTLDADVTDINGVKLTSVPLTWSSAYSQVATAATAGTTTTGHSASGTVTAGESPGITYISAACVPPSCNVNLQKPEYSNLVPVTVTGTALTPSIYVASSATPTSGVTNLIPIDASNNTAGTAVPFATGQVPDSMTFGQGTGVLWIGTNTGLVSFNPSSGTGGAFGTTLTNIKGTILAMSSNGATLVLRDVTDAVDVIATSSSSGTQYAIAGATAAAFSPDNGTVYIVSGSTLYALTPSFSSTPTKIDLASGVTAHNVSVLANGQVMFLAENAQFEVRASCDRSPFDTHAASPTLLQSLPDGSQMIATDSANVWGIGVTWTPPEDVVCIPPLASTTDLNDDWAAHANPGGAFTARQIIVTPDSKHVYITNNTHQLIAYDPASGAVTNISIGAETFTGGSTIDSAKVYVGAGDGKVHVITTSNNSDSTKITISGLCTGPCLPDLVAVQQK